MGRPENDFFPNPEKRKRKLAEWQKKIEDEAKKAR